MNNREIVAAVDLDGTILRQGKWTSIRDFGEPMNGALEFMTELHSFAKIIIHTCRCQGIGEQLGYINLGEDLSSAERAKIVAGHLLSIGIPFDSVWTGVGKPVADVYVDNFAVPCRPQLAYAILRSGLLGSDAPKEQKDSVLESITVEVYERTMQDVYRMIQKERKSERKQSGR